MNSIVVHMARISINLELRVNLDVLQNDLQRYRQFCRQSTNDLTIGAQTEKCIFFTFHPYSILLYFSFWGFVMLCGALGLGFGFYNLRFWVWSLGIS